MTPDKVKEQRRGLIGTGIFILLLYVGCNTCNKKLDKFTADKAELKQSNPSQWRRDQLKVLVDPDGSIDEVEDAVAMYLKDPSSFEHIGTVVADSPDSIRVRMDFRSRNSFGGMVVNSAIVSLDYEGRVGSVKIR